MEETLVDEKEALIKSRVPETCPFCFRVDGIIWTETEVHLSDVFYFDRAEEVSKVGADIKVFCTRCEEEIREEDVRC